MDDIVRVSGVSKGGIYWHFKSKDEIFLYLMEKELEYNQYEFIALLKESETATEQLRKYLIWYMKKAMDSSLHTLIAEFLTRAKNENVLNRLKDMASQKHTDIDIIYKILRHGVETGEFAPMDAQAMAEIFCALCEGIVSRFHMFHKNSDLLKRTFVAAEDIFIKAITQTDGCMG